MFSQLASALELREGQVDEVILGSATQVGEQGANLARTGALMAGLGEQVPGLAVNRFCASGLEAVNLGAARNRAGEGGLMLCGGVESTSRVPMFSDRGALWVDAEVIRRVGSVHMGVAADLIATEEGYGRDDLDGYALRTRRKARAYRDAGISQRFMVPVRTPTDQVVPAEDELLAYAPDATELAALPAAFADLGAAGQDALVSARLGVNPIAHHHTRASSPALADGAALVVLGDDAAARRSGRSPLARIVGAVSCAANPVRMLTAGQLAVETLLERHGLTPSDVSVFEFAEAFAATCLRFQRDLDVDDDRFNPGGGTMSMGHAFGATGAILALNVVDALQRSGERYGVAAVSGAAGLGVATLFERV